jgi:molecular chaperone GrpE
MSKHHDEEDLSYQLDTAEDDEIEILEIVGLDEDSPAARPAAAVDPDEIEVSVDDSDGEIVFDDTGGYAPTEAAPEREHLNRLRADFDNFKKRVDREREANQRQAGASLLKRLLPILDNFERAIATDAGNGADAAGFRDGVVLIFRHLLEELRRVGLAPIDTIGEVFDPNVHEAVATERDSGLPSQTIVEELQRGYLLYDRVLRPALVKVAMDSTDFDASGSPDEES